MIKVFKFQVSNWASSPSDSDRGTTRYRSALENVFTPQEVESRVNNWIDCNPTYQVKDIRVNTVDVEYHNNGRGNTIELWYTIIYEE